MEKLSTAVMDRPAVVGVGEIGTHGAVDLEDLFASLHDEIQAHLSKKMPLIGNENARGFNSYDEVDTDEFQSNLV